MKDKILIFILFLFFSSQISYGQVYEIVHDEQKYSQLNSMENGGWNFKPDWYYYVMHKNYSGAKMKWKWQGFKSGFVIEFDETKSNQKRIITERAAQLVEAYEIKKRTQQELDTITPVFNEEMYRTAERNVDLVYSQYKNDFQRKQQVISEALNYCLNLSEGKLLESVALIQQRNDYILAQIDYIHKTGEGYELENTKRQIAYEEADKEMQKVMNACKNLVLYAKCYYENTQSNGQDDIVQGGIGHLPLPGGKFKGNFKTSTNN